MDTRGGTTILQEDNAQSSMKSAKITNYTVHTMERAERTVEMTLDKLIAERRREKLRQTK